MPEDLHHVVGADVEWVGGKSGVEEALGLGLTADLHVEHAQSDRRLGPDRVGGGGQQKRPFGRVVLAAIGQALAERRVECGRPRVGRERRQLGRGRPERIDQQAAAGRQSSQRVLVAGVFRDGLLRGRLGVDKPLIRDIEVRQQHVRRRVMRVDSQGPLGLGPPRRQPVALQIGAAQGDQHFR